MTPAKTPEAASNPKVETFHEKLLRVQKDCHALNLTPEGEGQVQSRKYKYLTIQKLHAAVLPILHEAGLTWVTTPTYIPADNGEIIPALGYSLSGGEDLLEGVVPLVDIPDMQKLGSGITYARRYCLLAVLALTPDTDDDGAEASTAPQSTPKTTRASVPGIPLDRAKAILEAAYVAELASLDDDEVPVLRPALVAKLTEVGVKSGKLGHLNVDQAETIEQFIAKEAS